MKLFITILVLVSFALQTFPVAKLFCSTAEVSLTAEEDDTKRFKTTEKKDIKEFIATADTSRNSLEVCTGFSLSLTNDLPSAFTEINNPPPNYAG